MADNVSLPASTGKAASDQVTYSGDADAQVQLVRLVQTTGSEGSKTVVDLPGDATNGLLVNLGSNNDVTVTGTVTVGSHAVTNAGTFAVQVDGSALTALQLIDNIVHVDDAAFTLGTHSGVMAMGFAGTQSVDANDACALACTTAGALHVSDAGSSLTVDGTVSVSGTVTVDGSGVTQPISHAALTELAAAIDTEVQCDIVGALPAGTNAIGKLAANSGVDIGDVDILSIAAGDNNIGNVDIVTMPNVTLAAGTNTNEVVGDAAHGAAVAGNPLLVGLEGRSTAPTAVDDGDVVRALATTLGKLVVYPFALPANAWSYASPAAVTDTADDEAKAAVASTRHYITGIQVFNGHDSTGTEVVIKDGSTVLWRGWAEQTGGGCSAAFNPPLRGTANTAVNVANITNSSSTYFNVQGFSSSE